MSLLRAFIVLILVCASASAETTIRVGAAISLKDALTDLAGSFQKSTGDKVELTFGSSGQIQAQIRNGGDIDVFIAASRSQVRDLIKTDSVLPETQRVIAGNTLVLVVPADVKTSLDGFESLAGDSMKKLAIGEPKTVPAGAYAVEVLEKLGIYEKVHPRIVFGANVRQVLSYVERGEVSAGIVYGTDAKEAGEKVRIVATASEYLRSPIVYPAVVVKTSKKIDASKRFLDFLSTDQAKKTLTARGFSVPGESGAPKQ